MGLTLYGLLIVTSVVQATSFQHLAERALSDSYDYVIIGGGTAGITLASRLSADNFQSTGTVLVIEAGLPDDYEAAVMIPHFYPGASGFAPNTRYDWNLTSISQKFLSGQTINLTQGHTVGGSSTVNAMIFGRGMPSNYDAWAALGNAGWDFAGLLPYFIKFSPGPGLEVNRVEARKEVIVSAGALNTPKLLQLSGIGPAFLTSQHGILSIVDLPGVGANLQDHPFGLMLASLSTGIPGNYELENSTFDAEQKDLYYSERKGRWTDTIAEALAFIPLSNFTQSDVTGRLLSAISSSTAEYLPEDTDQTVKDGYSRQVKQILQMHQGNSTAGMELLYVDGGRSIVNILMHPLSRGTIAINSTDPFAPPVIDPRYLSHPYDGQVLVESLRFNRKLLATQQVEALGATETLPGVDITSDSDILEFIKGVSSTEYHYAGTCAMLPRPLGGVVDSNLNVHGIDGLRIVDASIMPLLPSAHTQATVYAIAEKVKLSPYASNDVNAADIIVKQYS
ncbi:choline dehydrogenase [Colletotrichum fioriniae PJ7]|uniref:Choline dehydrogenase n=1 Tax=Colletotrichum fioriniae PJ7 TaxID=1445577 RepID=A0A010QH27_9PEZI|nr:choline dehydrogenase [Colletotrichum fioriniae PJ7]